MIKQFDTYIIQMIQDHDILKFNFSEKHQRRKRSMYRDMEKTISRIHKGFQNAMFAYQYNLVKGIRNVVMSTNKIKYSIEKVVLDAIEDINRRINTSAFDRLIDEEAEEEETSDSNIIIDYCFGPIMGENYGVRTLLEYEEECQENITCAEDISGDSSETENFNFISRGNLKR